MKNSQTIRILNLCGLIGPLLFILVFLIEGFTRGGGYDPLRHPVSALAIGPSGWTQSANFILCGALIAAFAFGLHRSGVSRWGGWLLGLVGLGLIGAGLFTCDPLNGYPPGTPLVAVERTTHGKLHDLFSLPVFTALPAAAFVLSRRFFKNGRWAWWLVSILSGLAMLVFFVLAGMGFNQTPGYAPIAGLLQRVSIISGLGWVAALAGDLLVESRRDGQSSPSAAARM